MEKIKEIKETVSGLSYMHSAQDKLLLILAVLTLLDNSLQSATMDPFGRITVLLGKYVYYYYYY